MADKIYAVTFHPAGSKSRPLGSVTAPNYEAAATETVEQLERLAIRGGVIFKEVPIIDYGSNIGYVNVVPLRPLAEGGNTVNIIAMRKTIQFLLK